MDMKPFFRAYGVDELHLGQSVGIDAGISAKDFF